MAKKIKLKKSVKKVRAKSALPTAIGKGPAYLMDKPKGGNQPNSADSEMGRLMVNKGVSRKKMR